MKDFYVHNLSEFYIPHAINPFKLSGQRSQPPSKSVDRTALIVSDVYEMVLVVTSVFSVISTP